MSESTRGFVRFTRTVHIYLTMFSSIVLFFISLTGFMLNHKTWFGLGGPGGAQRPVATQGGAERLPTERSGLQPDRGLQPGAQRPDKSQVEAAPGGRPVQETGALAKLTNLHKGKPTRLAVVWLIDTTAGVLLLGSITGIILLLSHPRRRRLGAIVMAVGAIGALMIYLFVVP